MSRRALVAALALVTSGGAAALSAGPAPLQPSRAGDAMVAGMERSGPGDPPAYDGRFNFVRIRWDDPRGFGGLFGRGRGGARELACPREPLWAHDVCRGADQNFGTILDEMTLLDVRVDGKILTLDDPELFRHPIAYIAEVGYWQPGEADVDALRSFLLKGGFLIVDDFRSPRELGNFHAQMNRVLPGVQVFTLDEGHAIWDSFFHISDPSALAPPTYPQYVPAYLGIYEDNDPEGRLLVVINFNQDIGDYWEWAAEGFLPIPLTNDAFKFGVNYIMYGMTH